MFRSKTRFVFICLLFIVLIYFTYYDIFNFILHYTVPSSRKLHISTSNSERYLKFRSDTNRRISARYPKRWEELQQMYDKWDYLRNNKDPYLISSIQNNCKKMNDLEKIADYDCRSEWLFYLETGNIIDIGDMMGFAYGKKGGFEIIFEDGRKAMYKPCGSGSEWPENEIRSSHIDFALGFNRTPPSVMRNITFSSLNKIISKKTGILPITKKYVLQEMLETCGDKTNNLFYGAMIGWINELEDTKTITKKFKDGISISDVETYRNTLSNDYLTDILQNHLFFYLIGTLRTLGYNEYKVKNGSLLTVDLDRARFRTPYDYEIHECSFCWICKIKYSTLEMIQMVAEDNLLSLIIQKSLLYDPFQLTFSEDEQYVLQTRLNDFLSNCFNRCIQQYGYENVIIRN